MILYDIIIILHILFYILYCIDNTRYYIVFLDLEEKDDSHLESHQKSDTHKQPEAKGIC